MNDRDYFAAAALTGLLMNGDYSTDSIPSLAYSMADAMLRERSGAVRTAALSSPRKDVDMQQDDAGSAPMLGSQRPAAWVVKHGGLFMFVSQVEGVAETQCREGMVVVPLYEHAPPPPDRPVGLGFDDMRLTDEERDAIGEAIRLGGHWGWSETLRGLLERLK
jgi:hypothetical protein